MLASRLTTAAACAAFGAAVLTGTFGLALVSQAGAPDTPAPHTTTVRFETPEVAPQAAQETVTVTQSDGYVVKTGQAEAGRIRQAPNSTTTAPHEETDAEYHARLDRQFCEDQPWECPPGEQPDGRESQR